MELNIEILHKLSKEEKIIWKNHAAKRMKQRNIKTSDVEKCIATGEIIETYNSDYPAPSCLVLGLSVCNKYLHVVCSIYQDMLCIITTYFPTSEEWEKDLKTRKVVN